MREAGECFGLANVKHSNAQWSIEDEAFPAVAWSYGPPQGCSNIVAAVAVRAAVAVCTHLRHQLRQLIDGSRQHTQVRGGAIHRVRLAAGSLAVDHRRTVDAT